MPFLLKDLYALYPGVRTTNGSRLFADYVPDHENELVARYRRAGLVSSASRRRPSSASPPRTESALFGETRNPWNLEHTAGGSSGGAAAAVAAGIVPAAHASDGGGSIRVPASCCGLFGLKPTRGRIPFGPDAGEGWSGMSTAHAVTRSVRDSAALLDVVAGADLGAPYAAPRAGAPLSRRRSARRRDACASRSRSHSCNGSETHPDCVAAARDAAKLCAELGHEVEEAQLAIDARGVRPRLAGDHRGQPARHGAGPRCASSGASCARTISSPRTRAMYEAAAGADAAEYARVDPRDPRARPPGVALPGGSRR